MIDIQNVWKSYGEGRKRQVVLSGASVALPKGRKIALLGARGSGKSSLIRLLTRMEEPDKGAIRASGLMCWPFDYAGFVDKGATVQQNAYTMGHIFGLDGRDICSAAADISGVAVPDGKQFRRYTPPERKLISLGLTLALQFDWYFVDGDLPAIDPQRVDAVDAVIADRLSGASVIWATNDVSLVEGYCDAGLVLNRGKLKFYDTLAAASKAHLQAVKKEDSRRT